MRFVFKPVLKQHANRHDGMTLGSNYVRLSKQAAAHLAGTDAVQLAYDRKAICIRPVQGASTLAAERVLKISHAKGNDPHISCAVLTAVFTCIEHRIGVGVQVKAMQEMTLKPYSLD
jgi:hypothetical protein